MNKGIEKFLSTGQVNFEVWEDIDSNQDILKALINKLGSKVIVSAEDLKTTDNFELLLKIDSSYPTLIFSLEPKRE